MKYFIVFSYDGSKFSGYQNQPSRRTVQGELEKVLNIINNNKKVSVSASGRTDSGVHAYGQTAHFNLDIKITCQRLKKALNSLLPADIYVKNAAEINEDFHARFSAKAKEYIYKINLGEYNPIEKDYVFQYNETLDLDIMKDALKVFKGTHDFRSFVKIDEEKNDYVRTIIKASLKKDKNNPNIIIISMIGTGFMRYMVRNIVGIIIEAGAGKYSVEDIIRIIEQKDRKCAGVCAPACGLYLKSVYY